MRDRRTGEAFAKFKDDPKLYDIHIDRHPVPATAATERAVEELIQRNFESEFFLSAREIERQAERMRQALLQPPQIVLEAEQTQSAHEIISRPRAHSPAPAVTDTRGSSDDPFR